MPHEGLWQQLVELDGQKTARRANCRYITNPDRYIVTLLQNSYVVNLAGREIFSAEPGSPHTPAGFIQQLCILAY